MKEWDILTALGNIDEHWIEEAAPSGPAHRRARRFPVLLAAVIAALALFGGTLAVVVTHMDSIRGWLADRWRQEYFEEMDGDQMALIDHLTQPIGLSQTVDGYTVTLDSAMVGDDSFLLLVRITGLEPKQAAAFAAHSLEIEPAVVGMMGFGWSSDRIWPTEDGLAMLMDGDLSPRGNSYEGVEEITLHLTLTDLTTEIHGPRSEKPLSAGPWEFTFTLDRSAVPQTISLPDTAVTAVRNGSGDAVDTVIRELELTNMGIHFRYTDTEQDRILTDGDADLSPTLLLKNGQEIRWNGGSTHPEGNDLVSTWWWRYPVELDRAEAVRIGDTVIPLP